MNMTSQGALPHIAPPAPPPSWVGHPGLFGTKRNGAWTHPLAPGVVVRHCGHPTALRPYYITGLDEPRKFSTLRAAQLVVEGQFARLGALA